MSASGVVFQIIAPETREEVAVREVRFRVERLNAARRFCLDPFFRSEVNITSNRNDAAMCRGKLREAIKALRAVRRVDAVAVNGSEVCHA